MEQFVKHDDRKDEILKELEEAIKKIKRVGLLWSNIVIYMLMRKLFHIR